MIYLTSDTHFGHANIIKYCNRPFASASEMDRKLIENWNSVVTQQDTVYHLGDFGFYRSDDEFANIINRLNGNKFIIFGNHDKQLKSNKKLQSLFGGCFHGIHEVKTSFDDEKYHLVLCHYAMKVWNKSHRGSIHLYGHSHGTLPDDPYSYSMDVGVDCNNYTPISFSDVLVKMTKKMFKAVDHHGKED